MEPHSVTNFWIAKLTSTFVSNATTERNKIKV
jgi:hypothetical protein